MNNLTVYEKNKQPRQLGELVGSGGQGNVYCLSEKPNIVVKIFNADKLKKRGDELREKVHVQTQMRDLIENRYLTWPQIEVFNAKGEWIGYAMKRAPQMGGRNGLLISTMSR